MKERRSEPSSRQKVVSSFAYMVIGAFLAAFPLTVFMYFQNAPRSQFENQKRVCLQKDNQYLERLSEYLHYSQSALEDRKVEGVALERLSLGYQYLTMASDRNVIVGIERIRKNISNIKKAGKDEIETLKEDTAAIVGEIRREIRSKHLCE